MFKIKHFMDAVEPDDGLRVWVEPVGLTRDLREWCHVHGVLTHLGPTPWLWTWYDARDAADAYDYFRGRYDEHLSGGPHRDDLQELATLALRIGVTLLHQGEDPAHNTATALYEFLDELQAYCPPELTASPAPPGVAAPPITPSRDGTRDATPPP